MKVGPKRALSKTLGGPSAVSIVSPQRQRSFAQVEVSEFLEYDSPPPALAHKFT
jgi:hypothetical protein